MRSRCLRLLLLDCCLSLTGCVSGFMDHYSGKYRTLLKDGVPQEQVRKSIGTPCETVVQESPSEPS